MFDGTSRETPSTVADATNMRALKPMSVLTVLLCVTTVAIVAPLWTPLVLAAWTADLLRPLAKKFERILGGRQWVASVLTVLVALGTLIPLIGIVATLASSTLELLAQVRAALNGQGSLATILLGGSSAIRRPAWSDWAAIASRYGENAWRLVTVMGRASASALVAVIVFVAALYTFISDRERGYKWLEEHAPISPDALARMAGAFRETGRGLIVSAGGTALAQGIVATGVYLAIGIPRALIFGPLTAVCGFIPFVGSGLVWIPLAIELGVTGQHWRSVGVVILGVCVGLIDDLLRPFLTRYGKLDLSAFVVLVSMLGGIAVFGPSGALLGPLVVRLCVEALKIEQERRRKETSCSSDVVKSS